MWSSAVRTRSPSRRKGDRGEGTLVKHARPVLAQAWARDTSAATARIGRLRRSGLQKAARTESVARTGRDRNHSGMSGSDPRVLGAGW